jgi:hypothetical protein
MDRKHLLTLLLVAAILAALQTSGCGTTKPASFYLLNPLAVPEGQPKTGPASPDLTIVVGPIKMPAYLDRPQIVTRRSDNRLKIEEHHRWGGTLKEIFPRVLSENLSVLLATDRVALHPWRGSDAIDYRLSANLLRFDGSLGQSVTLKVRWALHRGTSDRDLLLMRTFDQSEVVDGDTYEAQVAAQSRLLERFSRDVADAILSNPWQSGMD